MSKYTLSIRKGNLTLQGDFEKIKVQHEDCLGQVSNPIANGETISFDVTKEQLNEIERRTAKRQNRLLRNQS